LKLLKEFPLVTLVFAGEAKLVEFCEFSTFKGFESTAYLSAVRAASVELAGLWSMTHQ